MRRQSIGHEESAGGHSWHRGVELTKGRAVPAVPRPYPRRRLWDQVRAGSAQERSLDWRFHDAGRRRRKWRNLWRCARGFPIWPSKSGFRWHTTRQPLRMHPASRDRQVAHRERGAGTKRRIKTHARREHRTRVSNISSTARRKKKLMRPRSLVSRS